MAVFKVHYIWRKELPHVTHNLHEELITAMSLYLFNNGNVTASICMLKNSR